ncbi:MAG: cold-shock protein [Chlamydiae bacterium]|nr:cold-shock protein [Chlamydiota bacterium]
MANGTVKWFNKEKGFGFIMPDGGGRDVYVNITNVQTPDNNLTDGQRVEYEMTVGRKGPEAVKVKSLS